MGRVTIVVLGHRANADGTFTLEDLPGSGGRIDIIVRSIGASFFLSRDIRRNVVFYAILMGGNTAPKTLMVRGDEVRYLNPDERNIAALIRHALLKPSGPEWRMASPGIYIREGGLVELLPELENIVILKEGGEDIRGAPMPHNPTFVLSDKEEFRPEELEALRSRAVAELSLGPLSYHTEHAIVIALNELDRRGEDP